MTSPRILLLDIETAPHKVYVWSMWGQNVAMNQIVEPGYTLCWAAKWLGEKKMMFSSTRRDGVTGMLEYGYNLMEEADAIVHYNGCKFDIPVLNTEFLKQGWSSPAPSKQIDLYQTAKRRFRLPSNKMDYVAKILGVEGKLEHKGMELWDGCMKGNKDDWKVMEEYNKQDIRVLEAIYHKMLPWIENHPNMSLYNDGEDPQCINCGSGMLQKRGLAYTKTLTYQRYQCTECGTWNRDRLNNTPKRKKGAIMTGVTQ